eukprot:scaffold4015_cov200-Skeletonema_marinoi.AAC.17
MGLVKAINEFFIKSTAEVEIMSESAPGEQLEQAQGLNELQHNQEISGLALESSSSASGQMRQLSSSLNSSGSGGKKSGRSVKLLLPVISGIVAIYLTYEYGIGKGVNISGGGSDRPDKPPTSTVTALRPLTDTFTKETLQDTSRVTTELNDLPPSYYGGDEQVQETLLENWRASLNMERGVFLSENNDGGQINDGIEENVNEDSVNHLQSGRILQNNKWKNKPTLQSAPAPPISRIGNDWIPWSGYPLGECEGDCDKNMDCAGDLICFQRKGTEKVPGCLGGEEDSRPTDYCIRPDATIVTRASPTISPTTNPTASPSYLPSSQPSSQPTSSPSSSPSYQPTSQPSLQPSHQPSSLPSFQPSSIPSLSPSNHPSSWPSSLPSSLPSFHPTSIPSLSPSKQPSSWPSTQPSSLPSSQPTSIPSLSPSHHPTLQPSSEPSSHPSSLPSSQPTTSPSSSPSHHPTLPPSWEPSHQPSFRPSSQPTSNPSSSPSNQPSFRPSSQPSPHPSFRPSSQPSLTLSMQPSQQPSTSNPTSSLQPTNKQPDSFIIISSISSTKLSADEQSFSLTIASPVYSTELKAHKQPVILTIGSSISSAKPTAIRSPVFSA